ncbi:MAG: hypothetical protein WA857_04460 [Candidatus Acidiferrum sp.]
MGFGFDDEEGVGVGAAGGAEFLAGVVEGVGLDGEGDAAFRTDDGRVKSRARLRRFAFGKKPFAKRDKDSQSAYIFPA